MSFISYFGTKTAEELTIIIFGHNLRLFLISFITILAMAKMYIFVILIHVKLANHLIFFAISCHFLPFYSNERFKSFFYWLRYRPKSLYTPLSKCYPYKFFLNAISPKHIATGHPDRGKNGQLFGVSTQNCIRHQGFFRFQNTTLTSYKSLWRGRK